MPITIPLDVTMRLVLQIRVSDQKGPSLWCVFAMFCIQREIILLKCVNLEPDGAWGENE